jgi:hypothetical protein
MTPTAATQHDGPPGSQHLFLRVCLGALTALLAVNLYTGAPLFAIWVGSRVQNGTQLTMTTVAVVIATLVACVFLLVFLLMRVEAAYKVLTNQPTKRRVSPWLRSMRGERDEAEGRRPLTGFEKALVIAVVGAVVAAEIWFFFFAGSSIG